MIDQQAYYLLAKHKERAQHYVAHGVDVGGNTAQLIEDYILTTGDALVNAGCSSCIAQVLHTVYELIKEYENG